MNTSYYKDYSYLLFTRPGDRINWSLSEKLEKQFTMTIHRGMYTKVDEEAAVGRLRDYARRNDFEETS